MELSITDVAKLLAKLHVSLADRFDLDVCDVQGFLESLCGGACKYHKKCDIRPKPGDDYCAKHKTCHFLGN